MEVPLSVQVGFENHLGVSIISSADLRKGICNLADGQSPSYQLLKDDSSYNKDGVLGRRFENFIADRIIGCQEGFRTDNPEDQPLQSLFYERSGPISAAIAVTIDMPNSSTLFRFQLGQVLLVLPMGPEWCMVLLANEGIAWTQVSKLLVKSN